MNKDRLEQLRDALVKLDKTSVQRIGKGAVRWLIQRLPGGDLFDAAIVQPLESAESERILSLVIEMVIDLAERQPSHEELQILRSAIDDVMVLLGALPQEALSDNARKVMLWIARRSETGLPVGLLIHLTEVERYLDVSKTEARGAMDELEYHGYVRPADLYETGDRFWPNNKLFWVADAELQDWNTERNAWELARALVEHESAIVHLEELREKLGWSARMLNPAATYLVENGLAEGIPPTLPVQIAYSFLKETLDTRRFVAQGKPIS